jgi:hypothetical protein
MEVLLSLSQRFRGAAARRGPIMPGTNPSIRQITMKKYLLFLGDCYYPSGGWNDFQSSFDTIEEARAAVPPNTDWWHIVDSETASEVERD